MTTNTTTTALTSPVINIRSFLANPAKKVNKLTVSYEKSTFARNIAADVAHGYTKTFYALAELIDNAIAAALGTKGKRVVYVDIVTDNEGRHWIYVSNSGKPVALDPMKNYGFGNKNSSRRRHNSFGTGMKQAFSVFDGEAIVATKHKKKVYTFDFTNWTDVDGLVMQEYDLSEWAAFTSRDDVVTVIKAEIKDSRELKNINAETLGAFYFPMLSSRRNRVYLRLNGQPVMPYSVCGTLLRSATVDENTQYDFIPAGAKVPVQIEAWEFLMNDEAANIDKVKFFQKNNLWHGMYVYANGRAVEHVGVSLFTGKRGGRFTEHPSFNSRVTIININFNEDDRSIDLPFASNNKSSVDWESDIGKKYREFLDNTFGDDYRKLNYNEIERRDRANIDYYFSTFIGESGANVEHTFNKGVSLKKHGWDTIVDGIYGKAIRKKDGSFETYSTKLVDLDLNEISTDVKRIDLSQAEIIVEYSGRHKPLTADKINTLAYKVKFIRDNIMHAEESPEGIVYCSCDSHEYDIEEAKKAYFAATKKNVRIKPWIASKELDN